MDKKKETFSEQQFSDAYPAGFENHYWIMARNIYIHRHLKKAGALDGTVLDIGCGRGYTVDYLRKKGVRAFGVEQGSSIEDAAGKPYIHVKKDAFMLEEGFRKSVRVILLLDVLEHIQDPAAFLGECMEKFPNCGLVLVTVPARMELWSNYDEYYGHCTRYDKRSLSDALGKAGLAPVVTRYFFHCLYLAGLLVVRLSGERRVAMRTPRFPLLQRLAALCMAAESLWLPSRIWGTSLMAMAAIQRTGDPDAGR